MISIISREQIRESAKQPTHTAEQRLAEHLNAVIDAQVRKDADRGQTFLNVEKALP
jgi:hypothetical protein